MIPLLLYSTSLPFLLAFISLATCQPPPNSFDNFNNAGVAQNPTLQNPRPFMLPYGEGTGHGQLGSPFFTDNQPPQFSGLPTGGQQPWNQSQQRQQQLAVWSGGSEAERGADIRIQLRTYSNPLQRVDTKGNLCVCPKVGAANSNAYQHCMDSNPGRRDTCLINFLVILSSDDGAIQLWASPLMPLSNTGQIGAESANLLQQPIDFRLDAKPSSIDVIVQSLGAVINPFTGDLIQSNTVSLVDTFSKPLNDSSFTPGTFQGGTAANSVQQVLSGQLLGTQLVLSYTVACRGRFLGPGCDLACNTSTINAQSAVCISTRTGYYSLCRWLSGNSQVADCKSCPWGIRENAYCQDEQGGVLDNQHAGVVSEGFRSSTIVLAIIAALLLACLIAIVAYMRKASQRRGGQRTSGANTTGGAPGYNSSYRTHVGEAETKALNSAGNPNGMLKGSAALVPIPAPRSGSYIPSSLNRPKRPLLYQLPPPAHLGGSASLNTSFAGSQAPLAPSVSADV